MSTRPESKTFPRLIDEQARRHGERPAIVGSGRHLTYAQLKDEAQRVARRLYRLGVRPGDKVAILMGNTPEWIPVAMGVTRIGATLVTLNTWATAPELEYLIGHSDSTYLIASPTFLKADFGRMLRDLEPHAERLPQLRGILGVAGAAGNALPAGWQPLFDGSTDADASADEAIAALAAAVRPTDIAIIAYTSGSTSVPKGVQLQHAPLIENNFDIGERMRVTEEDRLWLAVSLFWGYGCANALMNVLTHGACFVLQESFDAAEALRLIEEEKCTLYYGTANMAQALLEHPDHARRDLSSLRSGASAGSPEQFMRAVTLGAKGVCNPFGLTESYGFCFVTDCEDPLERRQTTVGRILPGFEAKVVSPDTGVPLAPGETGELRIRGHVTPGYYKQPEISAKTLDEEGYFRTGDLVSIDKEGYMQFHGRLKEMLKTGGINVSPAEVEAVLTAYPGVALAHVVGVADPVRDEIVAAVIVPKPGAMLKADEIIAYCKTNMAAFKVPRLVCFAQEEDVPLTTTGKVQKNKISAKFFPPK